MASFRRQQRGLSRVRCFAHCFNVVFLLAALGSIGVSVWVFLSVWQHPAREGTLYIVGVYYLVCNILPVAVGALATVIFLIGLCGLCTTNRCALLWYFSLVIVVFVFTIAAGIFNFIFYFGLQNSITSSLSTSVSKEYGLYGFEDLTASVDTVQTQLQCCGSVTYTEWLGSEWHRFQRLSHFNDRDVPTVPLSCCAMTTDSGNGSVALNVTLCSDQGSTYPNDYMHSGGCSEAIYQWLQLFALILAITCAALFITELLTIAACAALFRYLGPVHYEEHEQRHKKGPNRNRGHGGGGGGRSGPSNRAGTNSRIGASTSRM